MMSCKTLSILGAMSVTYERSLNNKGKTLSPSFVGVSPTSDWSGCCYQMMNNRHR